MIQRLTRPVVRRRVVNAANQIEHPRAATAHGPAPLGPLVATRRPVRRAHSRRTPPDWHGALLLLAIPQGTAYGRPPQQSDVLVD